jgi:hypothetical protein
MPIEEQAQAAVQEKKPATTVSALTAQPDESPVSIPPRVPNPVDAAARLAYGQRQFIKAQRDYIHNKDNQAMLTAQEGYIIDLTQYLEDMGL